MVIDVNGMHTQSHEVFVYLEKKEEDEDKKEGSEGEGSQEEKRSVRIHAMVTVFQFIMKQSYICALIAMMVSTCSGLWSTVGAIPKPLARVGTSVFPRQQQALVEYVNFS